MSEIATRTFSANFPGAIVKTDRLEEINPAKLRAEIGNIDLMLASPECTNHTCAKGAGPRSEESKATALQAIRFARAFKPGWIIIENVIHMRPWARYEEMKAELRSLGYQISEHILDAANFGVPQNRKRLFLVCGRDQLPTQSGTGQKTRTVTDILDAPGTWKTSPLFAQRRAPATLERAARGLEAVGRATPFLLVYYGSDGAGGWQPVDRPLRTITTVDRFALVTPTSEGHQMRMLQVPELMRAMGFTEEYQLPFGTRRQKVHMLGNGVCPPVMAALVSAIRASEVNAAQSLPIGRPSNVSPVPSDQGAVFEPSFSP